MSGRRPRDDDWDDARRGPSDDRRDDWADDVPDGWQDRGRPGSDRRAGDREVADRGLRDRSRGDGGPADRGFGDRGASDRGGSDRGGTDRGAGDRGGTDRGAGNYDFDDWYVGGAKRHESAQAGGSAQGEVARGGSARGGSSHGGTARDGTARDGTARDGAAHGGAAPGGTGQGGYRGPGARGQASGDSGRGQSRQDRGRHGDSGYGDYRQGRDYPDPGRDSRDEARYDDYGSKSGRSKGPASRREASPEFTPTVSASSAGGGNAGGRPYGRLSIFTLLDDKAGEFDRLAERAADGVRSLEPDTLVYVIHVVPKAPMQRIIYEIYRDRAAFDDHERQPHIQQFVADRKSCVLATNIIDLRLKYAKVAPLAGPAQPASGQASLPATAQRAPRALESGNRAPGDGRYGSPGNGRYSGPGDGGYQDSGSGRAAAAGSARHAEGDSRYADGEDNWPGDQPSGNRRSGSGDRGQGGDRGQSQYPGQRYGGN